MCLIRVSAKLCRSGTDLRMPDLCRLEGSTIRCTELALWQTFTCALFVCPEAQLRLRVYALAFSNTIIRNWCTQSVMFSEQDRTSDISKWICVLVWMQPVKPATVNDLISNSRRINWGKNVDRESFWNQIVTPRIGIGSWSAWRLPPLLYICTNIFRFYQST